MKCLKGHSRPLRHITAEYPKRIYYIFKREEIEELFLFICRENRLICGYCVASPRKILFNP